MEYQNENWDSTLHTQSFPRFKTIDDVLVHTELTRITLEAHHPEYPEQEGRYVVFVFNAEWVNNDYRLLSVALINEKAVEVSDQEIQAR